MIQRVQTLFLIAIIGLSSILFYKPFQVVKDNESTFFVTLMPGSLPDMVKPTIYGPMALNFIVMALAAFTIFEFKRRRRQIKICQIIFALSAILIGNLFVFTFLNTENSNAVINFTKYAFIPSINIVLAFLARYFINKDDKLVRSADRIR